MEQLDQEQTIWQSKDKEVILTTHRLREMRKSIWGSSIKSIMLEQLTSCELRTEKAYKLLRQAITSFLIINGIVYLLNHYLFKAEIIKFFFTELHIDSTTAMYIFYISILVSALYVALFFFSVTKVFSFHAHLTTINVEFRWLSFEERESFISKIENAKDRRIQYLNKHE